jgi:hypothetical protein
VTRAWLIAAAILLTGCSGTATPVITVTAAVPTATSETPDPNVISPSPSDSASPETNERGNIPKRVGDQALIITADGREAVRFTVTKIQPGFKCNSDYPDKSKNGQYVAIWMDITTTKAVKFDSDNDNDVSYFNTDDWQVIGPDGTTENDSSGNGYSCAKDSEALPTQIEGAKHVKGVVVVDTKYKHGHLALIQDYSDSGWEWDF